MLDELRNWFKKAWEWIQALWDKHDDYIGEMVQAILPMVVDLALRSDLSGDEKRKAIIDAVLDTAGDTADHVSVSMLNEAIELAANKYNIQIGKLTIDKIDAARKAALDAGEKFAQGKLNITGDEAENAGIKIDLPAADNTSQN